MADKTRRFPQNILGAFYVTEDCIACDACVVEAPGFFAMNDVEGHAYVKLQPQNPLETEKCHKALEACPVDAIGDDGNEENY